MKLRAFWCLIALSLYFMIVFMTFYLKFFFFQYWRRYLCTKILILLFSIHRKSIHCLLTGHSNSFMESQKYYLKSSFDFKFEFQLFQRFSLEFTFKSNLSTNSKNKFFDVDFLLKHKSFPKRNQELLA